MNYGLYSTTCVVNVVDTVFALSVTIDHAAIAIKVGEVFKLNATVLPEDAANKSVTWSSDNTDVATVDGTGLVTAISAGQAIITVTTQDGNKTCTSTVTVLPLVLQEKNIEIVGRKTLVDGEDIIVSEEAPVSPKVNQLWKSPVGIFIWKNGQFIDTGVKTIEELEELSKTAPNIVFNDDEGKIDRLNRSESSIAVLNDKIVSKVEASEVSSIIEQNPYSVRVAFNKITPDIQNINGTFYIENGRLQVTNGNGTVIIDGSSNIHKIVATGIIDMFTSTGATNNTVSIVHNLGYKPVYQCFQQDIVNDPDISVSLPAFSLGGVTSDGIVFDSIIRARVDEQRLYIDLLRSQSYADNGQGNHIRIRYFVYKEVAF